MKTPKLSLLLFSFFLYFFISGCEKTKTPKEPQLPEETQRGAYTFGCLVDGRLFLPYGGSVPDISIEITAGKLMLSSYQVSHNEAIDFEINDFYDAGEYDLKLPTTAIYFFDSIQYDTFEGKLTITKYDKANRIIAGRFYFKAKDAKTGKIVSITAGRFDVPIRN